MGRRDRERRAARILAGLELPVAKKRDVQDAVPCSDCGASIPKRVLRAGHGDVAWCGVLVVTARDDPVLVPLV